MSMSDINLDFLLIAIRMVANWNSFGSKLKISIILEERVDISVSLRQKGTLGGESYREVDICSI